MLEDDLKFAKIELSTIKVAAPLIILIAAIWYWMGSKDEDKILCTGLLVVVGGVLSAILIARSHAKKLSLERYVFALKSKKFDDALYYGRMYYGVKRNGMKGLSGNGLTIFDEQAINNDISAYSKI